MIDEKLKELHFIHGDMDNCDGLLKEALTAIYEIGLECIGADIKPHKEESLEVKSDSYLTPEEMYQNDLRASQRKAWAKACGVAE